MITTKMQKTSMITIMITTSKTSITIMIKQDAKDINDNTNDRLDELRTIVSAVLS